MTMTLVAKKKKINKKRKQFTHHLPGLILEKKNRRISRTKFRSIAATRTNANYIENCSRTCNIQSTSTKTVQSMSCRVIFPYINRLCDENRVGGISD